MTGQDHRDTSSSTQKYALAIALELIEVEQEVEACVTHVTSVTQALATIFYSAVQ